jgi:hypothetical protein
MPFEIFAGIPAPSCPAVRRVSRHVAIGILSP